MDDKSPERPCRRLRTHEIEQAVGRLAADSSWPHPTAGFIHLAEEPGLYNKWLYGIADADGRYRLVGLARRFCPTHNQTYVGVSPYHPALTANPVEMFESLATVGVVNKFLRLPKSRPLDPRVVRGLLHLRVPASRARIGEWVSENPFEGEPAEREVGPAEMVAERRRTTWDGATGPLWRDGGRTVEVGRPDTAATVYELQNCVDMMYGHTAPHLYAGVRAAAEYNARHGHLSMFTRGTFLLCWDGSRAVGCAWAYRSFNPARCGWHVWVRRPYVPPADRRRGVVRSLVAAAVGMFAEAGHPTWVRWLDSRGRAVPAGWGGSGQIYFHTI